MSWRRGLLTVINPGQGRAEGRTVRVAGEKIEAIEPAAAGAGGQAGFSGAYLIPGLIDMHVQIVLARRALARILD
jgi:imidazolonepropionase-like amidohydrolase